MRTYALLDEGSTVTLIDRSLLRKLGVRGPRLNLEIKGIRARVATSVSCQKVQVKIRGSFSDYTIENAIAISEPNLPSQSLPTAVVQRIIAEQGIPLHAYTDAQPDILIGQDNCHLIATHELRETGYSNFVLSRSLLGWALHGPGGARRTRGGPHNVLTVTEKDKASVDNSEAPFSYDEKLDELVKSFFQIDNLGIAKDVTYKDEHDHARKTLKETTRFLGNAWETGLLWKEKDFPCVDSFTTARKRLASLERKLDRDRECASLYYAEMDRLVQGGYVKKIPQGDSRSRVWYLPHFGVQRPEKPGKLRVVFDAAARSGGQCLNDLLETGPDLLRPLPGILLRFRQYRVAVKADIKDMFLRVRVREEDRAAQRFLWRGRDRHREPDVYEMDRLIFGSRASPCSAVYVKDQNAELFAKTKPIAAQLIKRDSYMDDFLTSQKSTLEAATLVGDIIEINAHADFEMHDWASNESAALKAVDKNNRGLPHQHQLCGPGKAKVLGILWDTQSDELGFNVALAKIPEAISSGERTPTKREYLSICMSVFDPLGLLAPLTLRAKVLMQEIWRSGIGWDAPLRAQEYTGWLTWFKLLQETQTLRVPRCISPVNTRYTSVELHAFCDASLTAYAAVIYIRFALECAPAHVALITAKTRTAPLKPLSVPRLELQAALLGSRLLGAVQQEIDIRVDRRYLWSDSSTVVHWIKSEPRTRQVFVANRLGEIGELTQTTEWRWLPSSLNPADDATRWSGNVPDAQQRWFLGPSFLKEEENAWPLNKHLDEQERKTIDDMELRKAIIYTVDATVDYFPTTGRFLGWPGLLAVSRRVQNLFNRWTGRNPAEFTHESTNRAEQYWFREIQSQCFAQELQVLRDGRAIPKSSKLTNLQPFIGDDGILRANGRVTKILGFEFENNPIILESRHWATRALMMEYHRRFLHASSDSVVNELRQKFYILGLRRTLRSLIGRCIICKMRRGKPQSPRMSALPSGRLAYRERPFTHCGVDYFGPMFVKIGRRREKRWGVLFTCLSTRAIHLELAHTLSASSAIMALQRLAARRGSPLVMYSDNGTNFTRADKELQEAVASLNTKQQEEYAVKHRMKWMFNPPDAPHMGGAWERLVRSVKTAIGAVLREQAPSEEVLHTLLTEVEHTVNSRPLTHVSVDPRDGEALTPNHFLIGTSSGEIKLGNYDAHSVCPRKQFRIAQAFADAFWRRWLKEYLPSLIRRPKWNSSTKPLVVGDIVMIMDQQAPRNAWKRGTIVAIYPGADGEVRVAKVRTAHNEYIRPTRKLIKLLSAN